MDIMFNPKVDKPVKDWHADQLHNFYGKDKGNYKFSIYLTPTSSNNGCLAYVNQSNNLSNTIANLMSIGELPKEIIYTLKQYSNFISKEDIKKKILNSKKPYNIDLDKVINNVNKVNSNPATNELDISMENAGDCLLFDETGMHRGFRLNKIDMFLDLYIRILIIKFF